MNIIPTEEERLNYIRSKIWQGLYNFTYQVKEDILIYIDQLTSSREKAQFYDELDKTNLAYDKRMRGEIDNESEDVSI